MERLSQRPPLYSAPHKTISGSYIQEEIAVSNLLHTQCVITWCRASELANDQDQLALRGHFQTTFADLSVIMTLGGGGLGL